MFKVGDKVVLVGAGTKDVLLEIVEHMYTPDMHRVKIIATFQYGPVFKNDIRHATLEEETAGHRIDLETLRDCDTSPNCKKFDEREKCREEFERIEWVKDRLKHVWWSQKNEYCDTGKHSRANASFLNGALHMFREQQSKVDELQKRVDASLIAFEKLKEEINQLHGQCDLHLIKYLEEKSQVLEQALKGVGNDFY